MARSVSSTSIAAHRSASLALGRVEAGRVFAASITAGNSPWDGTVLETPNVADPTFKDRFKARGLSGARGPAASSGSISGRPGADAGIPAAGPFFELTAPPSPAGSIAVVNCNYVQVIEGLVDSSHLTVAAHRAAQDHRRLGGSISPRKDGASAVQRPRPRIEAEGNRLRPSTTWRCARSSENPARRNDGRASPRSCRHAPSSIPTADLFLRHGCR